jgi:hypothetical protein
MSDDNPYRAPSAEFGRRERSKRHSLGPVAASLFAIVLATAFNGGIGLLASVIAVGSWWAYKFRPRPTASEAPEARDFLRRLEGSASSKSTWAEPDGAVSSEPGVDVLGELRL